MSLFDDLADNLAAKTAEDAAEAAPEAETVDETAAEAHNSFESIRSDYYAALRNEAIALTEDHNFDLNEADIRFSTALNLRKVRNALVAIVGAGGLGNWQWRILAAMGFKRIAIYDDDTVGIENVGPQAHSIFDLGMPKVEAVQKAALQYRGIEIIARNMRVSTFREIADDLSEVPDVIIGCTDSAEFRNAMIGSFKRSMFYDSDRPRDLPQLFLDYRMSLGDWTAYIIPVRKMAHYHNEVSGSDVRCWFDSYTNEAVFPPDEAVQEPCTERAIAYTGANVASFTGAVLHWYFSGGSIDLGNADGMRKFFNCGGSIGWRCSFSSRDFEFISDTPKERKLREKLSTARRKVDFFSMGVVMAYNLDLVVPDSEIGWYCDSCVSRSTFLDVVCNDNAGDLLMFPKSDDMYMIGLDGAFYRAAIIKGGDCSELVITERVDRNRISFPRTVYHARSHRSAGFSIMLRKPEGTLFKKRFEGTENDMVWYRMRSSLDNHVLIDVCIETHNRDDSKVFTRIVQSFDLSEYKGSHGCIYALGRSYDLEECTDADITDDITARMDVFAASGKQFEAIAAEVEGDASNNAAAAGTAYEPIAVTDIIEGMVITTSNEPGAEELTVASVNPLTVKNGDGEVYRVGRRSYGHLYRVVHAEGGTQGDTQNDTHNAEQANTQTSTTASAQDIAQSIRNLGTTRALPDNEIARIANHIHNLAETYHATVTCSDS